MQPDANCMRAVGCESAWHVLSQHRIGAYKRMNATQELLQGRPTLRLFCRVQKRYQDKVEESVKLESRSMGGQQSREDWVLQVSNWHG